MFIQANSNLKPLVSEGVINCKIILCVFAIFLYYRATPIILPYKCSHRYKPTHSLMCAGRTRFISKRYYSSDFVDRVRPFASKK